MAFGMERTTANVSKEFVVEGGDFSHLEIRSSGSNGLHYFYDTAKSRLITDFVLHDGPRVATICTVTIIYRDGEYTPRLKFWKKDKTKQGQVEQLTLSDVPDTRLVKAVVDTDDGHKNLWLLIDFLQQCQQLTLPAGEFTIIGKDSAKIAGLLAQSDKEQVVRAMQSVLGGSLTQAELDIITNRKGQLELFEKLLTDPEFFQQCIEERNAAGRDAKPEAVWQAFFEKNQWIFGYGLNLVSCQAYDEKKLEQITTGASKFAGAGKRSDALLQTRGVVSSLMFCEIKRHDTLLLNTRQYREPDVWSPSAEVVGAVSQVQKTAEKAVREIRDFVYKQYAPDGTPGGVVASIRPRQVVVAGMTSEFLVDTDANPEKVAAFELYRRSISDVEIITFDELYARARFIIHD